MWCPRCIYEKKDRVVKALRVYFAAIGYTHTLMWTDQMVYDYGLNLVKNIVIAKAKFDKEDACNTISIVLKEKETKKDLELIIHQSGYGKTI